MTLQLKGSIYPLHLFGYVIPGYAAMWALIVNLVVSIAVSVLVRVLSFKRSEDRTRPENYLVSSKADSRAVREILVQSP